MEDAPSNNWSPLNASLDGINQSVLAAYSEKFQRLTRWDTFSECIVGCGVAGAVYLFLTISVYLWLRSAAIAIFLAWPFLIVFGFFAGAIFGILASMIVLPINASLNWPLRPLWFSFVVGGLSGFLPFLILLMASLGLRNINWIFWATTGPFPQMVLGHLCAYWLTEKAINDHNQRPGIVEFKISQSGIRSSRFGIIHIMILSAWAALGFSLLSCFPSEFQALLARLYLPLQCGAGLVAIVLIGALSLVRHYGKRDVSATNH